MFNVNHLADGISFSVFLKKNFSEIIVPVNPREVRSNDKN